MNDAKKQARTFSSLQDRRFCKQDSAPGTNLGHYNPNLLKDEKPQLRLLVTS